MAWLSMLIHWYLQCGILYFPSLMSEWHSKGTYTGNVIVPSTVTASIRESKYEYDSIYFSIDFLTLGVSQDGILSDLAVKRFGNQRNIKTSRALRMVYHFKRIV